MKKSNIGLFWCIVLLVSFAGWAEWNLPYPQPAKYNYTSAYADDITLMVTNNPAYFKDKMKTKWNYFKTNYIMSNGLVNHMRWDGNNVIGTNEAVSEGQGYGMILALLNNDQATFNRIFEAANSIMWNNSTKSYYCWDWSGGCRGQGAAADADLDIGLALVFADKLVIQRYWNAHSNPDYKTRALEIIRTIRTKMCDGSNYLLAGDNWGGSSPQNPSYYATAWMKVFNNYCKANSVNDIDFTPVISRCYEVLAKVRNYSKGQAPDWCNTSGQAVGGKSYDMGPDGIRTPYRIAMDAIWFNETRAVTYCKNIKNTLTQYSNSNPSSLILQMGQYTEGGSVVTETYRCNEIGLWMCGALGSKDQAFQKGVFRQKVLLEMQGDYAFFGSPTWSDDKFYFKQATAMLAYAAFTGMFPNVWDDTFAENKTSPALREKVRQIRTVVSGNEILLQGMSQQRTDIGLFSMNGQVITIRTVIYTKAGCRVTTKERLARGSYLLKITSRGIGSDHSLVMRFAVP